MKMEYFKLNIAVLGCKTFKGDIWDKLLIGDIEMKRNIELLRVYLDYSRPKRREPLER